MTRFYIVEPVQIHVIYSSRKRASRFTGFLVLCGLFIKLNVFILDIYNSMLLTVIDRLFEDAYRAAGRKLQQTRMPYKNIHQIPRDVLLYGRSINP